MSGVASASRSKAEPVDRLAYVPLRAFQQPADHLAGRVIVVDHEHPVARPVAAMLGEHGEELAAVDRLGEVVGGAQRVAALGRELQRAPAQRRRYLLRAT